MTPEDILRHPARILSSEQREQYFRTGFAKVESLIPALWLSRLKACSDRFLDASRTVTQSDDVFDLGAGHSAVTPHVRRLKALVDRDPVFWDFASGPPMADIAADLVGPDVKFHSAKLNYKSPGTDEIVKWHQDIPAWPHTNYSPVTLGVYLSDVTPDQGPLVCVPESHNGPLFVHRDADNNWTGSISEPDLARVELRRAEALAGPAGTVVAINCRTVHGSQANRTGDIRPLALFVYSSADAFAWMPPPSPTSRTGAIIRGGPPRFAHVDPRPCPVPPNWAEVGYGSIFEAQRGLD